MTTHEGLHVLDGLTLPTIIAGAFLFLVFQVALGSLIGRLLGGRT
jgi:hypothetical protein